jgi:hypothetical protein
VTGFGREEDTECVVSSTAAIEGVRRTLRGTLPEDLIWSRMCALSLPVPLSKAMDMGVSGGAEAAMFSYVLGGGRDDSGIEYVLGASGGACDG